MAGACSHESSFSTSVANGLYDRVIVPAAWQERMDDVARLWDAVRSELATLFGVPKVDRSVLMFGPTYPARGESIVLYEPSCDTEGTAELETHETDSTKSSPSGCERGTASANSLLGTGLRECEVPCCALWGQDEGDSRQPRRVRRRYAALQENGRRAARRVHGKCLVLHEDLHVNVRAQCRYLAEYLPNASVASSTEWITCHGSPARAQIVFRGQEL